jgi:hypothetical protein
MKSLGIPTPAAFPYITERTEVVDLTKFSYRGLNLISLLIITIALVRIISTCSIGLLFISFEFLFSIHLYMDSYVFILES